MAGPYHAVSSVSQEAFLLFTATFATSGSPRPSFPHLPLVPRDPSSLRKPFSCSLQVILRIQGEPMSEPVYKPTSH
jgi:hypothetical protein